MRTVSVSLNGNNQIELRVGSESRTGECYYLGLEPDSAESQFNPRRGVARLLRQWLNLGCRLEDDGQLFLPFDFSDEFTRWLTIRRTGRDATIVLGWAPVEGWAISLDDFSEFALGLPGFSADEPLVAQSFYFPRVLSDLRASIATLDALEKAT